MDHAAVDLGGAADARRCGCPTSAATPRWPRRVLVLGLAAMALNFLLGFTGVMSFGHAAYFGLGAYGAGLMLQIPVRQHAAWPCWPASCSGGIAGTLFGLLIVRRRGVYFAMVHHRVRPDLLLHRLSAGTASPAATTGCAASTGRRCISGSWTIDIRGNGTLFYYFVLFVFAVSRRRRWRSCCARRSAARCSRSARTSAAPASSASRWSGTSGWRSSISCFFTALAGALYALLNNFADPTRAALHHVGRDRHHGGDGRHAQRSGGRWSARRCSSVLQDYISSMTVNWMSFVGLIFVLVVLFFPRGLLGMLQRRAAT